METLQSQFESKTKKDTTIFSNLNFYKHECTKKQSEFDR